MPLLPKKTVKVETHCEDVVFCFPVPPELAPPEPAPPEPEPPEPPAALNTTPILDKIGRLLQPRADRKAPSVPAVSAIIAALLLFHNCTVREILRYAHNCGEDPKSIQKLLDKLAANKLILREGLKIDSRYALNVPPCLIYWPADKQTSCHPAYTDVILRILSARDGLTCPQIKDKLLGMGYMLYADHPKITPAARASNYIYALAADGIIRQSNDGTYRWFLNCQIKTTHYFREYLDPVEFELHLKKHLTEDPDNV